MKSLKELLRNNENYVRAPDRNPLIAPQADLAKTVKNFLNQYETKKLGKIDSPWNRYGSGHSFGDLLFGESPELLDDMSYGKNPFAVGKTGRIPIPDKRLLDMPVPIPATGGLGVIKNKGGNWLTGSVENALKGLKRGNQTAIDDAGQYGGFDAAVATANQKDHPINSWIDNTLTKYVKNRMATPDDEVRKLADQGILHYEPRYTGVMKDTRTSAGFPEEGMAQSPLGHLWEDISDDKILSETKGVRSSRTDDFARVYPEFSKVADNAQIYQPYANRLDNLGWEHLIDELLNAANPTSGLPMNLRMKPEGFKGLSMEEAVKKVHGINAFRAEQALKENARFAQAEGIPVYKDYGDGARLLEYKMGDDLPKGWSTTVGEEGRTIYVDPDGKMTLDDPRRTVLDSWLKQEGDTMGHCVGGYCDAVTSGQSRILSLRDKKGKSRATIELSPGDHRDSEHLRSLWMEDPDTDMNFDEWLKSHYPADYEKGLKERIVQIKGPGNRAPDPDVLPYLQDFVKSGNWSNVSDLNNVGLRDVGSRFDLSDPRLGNIDRYVTNDQYDSVSENIRKLLGLD